VILGFTWAEASCTTVAHVPTSTDVLTNALRTYYDSLAVYDAACRSKKPGPQQQCIELHLRLASLLNAEKDAAEWNLQPPGTSDKQLAMSFARMDAELDLTRKAVAAVKAAR
jgi:hypothetical protein